MFKCVISLVILVMSKQNFAKNLIHYKCRGGIYPRSTVERFFVPDDKVCWKTQYDDYKPNCFNAPSLQGKPWADPDIDSPNFKPKWNMVDGKVNRSSHIGTYNIVNQLPQNPIGRTGICGRGVLGRWGPNHAADPVVTRWKRLDGKMVLDPNKKPILQFVAIKRGDSGEWALPGGMVDPGELDTVTAVREFREEALNSLAKTEEETAQWTEKLNTFFSTGEVVYKGYVDDWRNTDNAWLETVAYNFHDETGTIVGSMNLQAGDDAVGVCWVDITPTIKLYASHEEIVQTVNKKQIRIFESEH
ncbi:hypothetical protein ACJJTC_013251 [Scirpophaga incertulas]